MEGARALPLHKAISLLRVGEPEAPPAKTHVVVNVEVAGQNQVPLLERCRVTAVLAAGFQVERADGTSTHSLA